MCVCVCLCCLIYVASSITYLIVGPMKMHWNCLFVVSMASTHAVVMVMQPVCSETWSRMCVPSERLGSAPGSVLLAWGAGGMPRYVHTQSSITIRDGVL